MSATTDVIVKLENVCLPARVIGKEEERFIITIKYSKLACELGLVSVTMCLPPSRVEFEEIPETYSEVKYVKPPPSRPVHTSNVSASSELSSNSSDWHYSVEDEKFYSGDCRNEYDSLYELTEPGFENSGEKRKRLPPPGTMISSWSMGAQVLAHTLSQLPKDTFYFHSLVFATRDGLQEALGAEVVEDLVFEFLGVDPKFFVVNIPDLGYSPLTWHRWAQQFLMRPSAYNGWLALCDSPASAVDRSRVLRCDDPSYAH